jgi:hypothetical protein
LAAIIRDEIMSALITRAIDSIRSDLSAPAHVPPDLVVDLQWAMGRETNDLVEPCSPCAWLSDDAVAALEASGAKMLVIEPDQMARNAMGANPLNPNIRKPSAKAGLAQGQQLAQSVGNFWSVPA